MSPCLTLSIIRKRSRINWKNSGNGVAPSPTRLRSPNLLYFTSDGKTQILEILGSSEYSFIDTTHRSTLSLWPRVVILNKSWRQHPTRHQLYGHLPSITKTIQVRRTRHAGHCWRSRDELIRDVLLWTPTHGRAKVGRPARTYIQQIWEDTGCCPEDLLRAMNDREEWREKVRDIRATSATWWWWWWWWVITTRIHIQVK